MDERKGLLWALAAIAVWATLAATTGDALEGVAWPTLLFWALAFSAATLALVERLRGRSLRATYSAPPRVIATGLLGIFGYHALLFAALGRAPLVEANLLNYLWPLFMVLLAPVLAGERLRAATLAGAGLGFAGAGLVVTRGQAPDVSAAHAAGYGLALAAALAWATFSVLLRRLGAQGEDRMALFCATSLAPTAVLALATSGLAPPSGRALAAAAWLGVGPMGLAFLFWNRALALASASRVGALAYLAPLLSTLLVVALLGKRTTWATWAGAAVIVAGAAVSSLGRAR